MNRKRKISKKIISVPILLKQPVEENVYSEIIVQLIKYLLYVRGQIPFNYDTFRLLINSNKSQYEDTDRNKIHIMAARRYSLCESTLKSINTLFENLKKEILNNFENIEQMSVIFGGTPVSPKEVYVISKLLCSFTAISNKSSKQTHTMIDVLRSLLKSEQLQQLLTKPLPLTNMYVLIKKRVENTEKIQFFLPKDNYILPVNCIQINFDFNEEIEEQIVNEQCHSGEIPKPLKCETSNMLESEIISSNDQLVWFQSTEIVKGIKEEMVNGKSIWK